MDAAAPILIGILVLAIVILSAVFSAKAAKARRDMLAAWAASKHLSFDPDDDPGQSAEFPQFDIFQRGSSRRAYNTMRGVVPINGRPFPIKCGDYRYTVSNGKNSSTYRISYIVLTLPFPNVPGLDIRREGLLDRVAGVLGFQDINFESEEFSRKFFVKCEDRRFAYLVITPKMMEFLLACNPPPIHISRGQICLAGADMESLRRWDPPDFDRRLAWAEEFFALWPNAAADGA